MVYFIKSFRSVNKEYKYFGILLDEHFKFYICDEIFAKSSGRALMLFISKYKIFFMYIPIYLIVYNLLPCPVVIKFSIEPCVSFSESINILLFMASKEIQESCILKSKIATIQSSYSFDIAVTRAIANRSILIDVTRIISLIFNNRCNSRS